MVKLAVHFRSTDPTAHALVWLSSRLDQDPRSEAEGDGDQVLADAADTHPNSPEPVLGLLYAHAHMSLRVCLHDIPTRQVRLFPFQARLRGTRDDATCSNHGDAPLHILSPPTVLS